jgi:hypothetical protein
MTLTPGVTNAFTLDNIAAIGLTDSLCTGDYISIPGKLLQNNTTVLCHDTQHNDTQQTQKELCFQFLLGF